MKIIRRLLLVLALLALAAGGGVWFVYQRVHVPYRGFTGAEQFVDIAPGTGASTIGAQLAAAGVVRDAQTFRAALWLSGRARDLKAGEYRFDRDATPLEVIDRISHDYTGQPFAMRSGVVYLVDVEKEQTMVLPFEDTPA